MLAVVVLAAVTVPAVAPTAAFSQTQPSLPREVVPALTEVATFFGAGVVDPEIWDPGQSVVLDRWSDFAENITEPGPALALGVYAYFENDGPGVQVVLTTDDTPSGLVAAMTAFVPPAPRVAGDVFAVPALAGFSGVDYDQVATGLVAVAEAANGIALLDPPAGTVQAVVETYDVAPLLDAAEHLRSVLPPGQQDRAVLYGNRVTTRVAGAAWLPGAPAAGTTVPLAGLVAGVFANNDADRGVWTAPAGTSASLVGVGDGDGDLDLELLLTNEQVGQLNVEAVNTVMAFPGYGPVVWGARTLAGTDLAQSPWKYVSTRRLANYIEHSIEQSLGWCTFEPNAPPLWQAVADETTKFLSDLYGAGAFSGPTAAAAFQVAVDATTMTPEDIVIGRLVGQVEFQTTPPVQFVVLTINQPCGEGGGL